MSDRNAGHEGRGGIGFIGGLQLLFIGLKLCGQIDWSWWWVLSPTIVYAAVIIPVAFAFLVAIELLYSKRK